MAKIRKRTEVTLETETLVMFPRGADALCAWCERCGIERPLLTPAAAARLSGVTASVIYDRVSAGSVHFIELPGGRPLICASSVLLNNQAGAKR
jgi:hypothetical protein